MIVICNKVCGYREGNFCAKSAVSINELGLCSVWWDKQGNPRPQRTEDTQEDREKIYVEELELEEK